MAESYIQKMRPLLILEYLQKHSSPSKPISTPELITFLVEEKGISCDRKTVYSDIKALTECDFEIFSTHGRYGGFYIESTSEFERSELKLLIDAVCSSRYLTEDKSRKLIEKLCKLCNQEDAELLKRSILVSGRVKTMNKSIYYNVDAIQEAIAGNKQISFRYFDWDIGGKRRYRKKEYLASPYGLCQDHENCYLLAYSDRHGITSYRVDRMSDIEAISAARVPCPELSGKALYQHANRLFQMYSGEEASVKLRFHRDLINAAFDRFGHDIMLIPDGDAHFTFVVNIAVSPMFLSWIIGFGDKAKILLPESVAKQCVELCQKTMAQYSQTQMP